MTYQPAHRHQQRLRRIVLCFCLASSPSPRFLFRRKVRLQGVGRVVRTKLATPSLVRQSRAPPFMCLAGFIKDAPRGRRKREYRPQHVWSRCFVGGDVYRTRKTVLQRDPGNNGWWLPVHKMQPVVPLRANPTASCGKAGPLLIQFCHKLY